MGSMTQTLSPLDQALKDILNPDIQSSKVILLGTHAEAMLQEGQGTHEMNPFYTQRLSSLVFLACASQAKTTFPSVTCKEGIPRSLFSLRSIFHCLASPDVGFPHVVTSGAKKLGDLRGESVDLDQQPDELRIVFFFFVVFAANGHPRQRTVDPQDRILYFPVAQHLDRGSEHPWQSLHNHRAKELKILSRADVEGKQCQWTGLHFSSFPPIFFLLLVFLEAQARFEDL